MIINEDLLELCIGTRVKESPIIMSTGVLVLNGCVSIKWVC